MTVETSAARPSGVEHPMQRGSAHVDNSPVGEVNYAPVVFACRECRRGRSDGIIDCSQVAAHPPGAFCVLVIDKLAQAILKSDGFPVSVVGGWNGHGVQQDRGRAEGRFPRSKCWRDFRCSIRSIAARASTALGIVLKEYSGPAYRLRMA